MAPVLNFCIHKAFEKEALKHFGLTAAKVKVFSNNIFHANNARLQQGDSILKNNKAMYKLSILYLTSIKDYGTCLMQ